MTWTLRPPRPQYAIDRALVVDDHAVVFDGEPAAAARSMRT